MVRSGGVSKSKAAEGAATAVHEHFSHPNVLVAHLQEGIEVIHLYTGASQHAGPTLCPSVSSVFWKLGCTHEHMCDIVLSPITFRCTAGRTICKLHLPSPGLHADINGDGVLDHVQAYGENLIG